MRAASVGSHRARGRCAARAWLLTLLLALASGRAAVCAQLLPIPGLAVQSGLSGMRALRYTGMVAQQRDFSCGAAALTTLLDDGYGFDFSEAQTIAAMMRVVAHPAEVLKSGFSMLDMKAFVETLGLHAVGFEVNMAAMRRLRIPVIVLLEVDGYSHFVVVKKVDRDLVFISDPALGNRALDVDVFARSWQGLVLAVVGRPFLVDSPLLRDNVSRARQAHDVLLHQAAPVAEFGIPKFGSF